MQKRGKRDEKYFFNKWFIRYHDLHIYWTSHIFLTISCVLLTTPSLAINQDRVSVANMLSEQLANLSTHQAASFPNPKISREPIKPSGNNRTKPSSHQVLFFNILPDAAAAVLLQNVMKHQVEVNNVQWVEDITEVQPSKTIGEELEMAHSMFKLNYSASIATLTSYYINFYAYNIPWQLQPNLISLMSEPLRSGVNILSRDPFGPSFQQKKEFFKSVQKQKS